MYLRVRVVNSRATENLCGVGGRDLSRHQFSIILDQALDVMMCFSERSR